MHFKRRPFVLGQRIAITTLGLALTLSTMPTAAFAATSAELQSELEAAQAQSASYEEQTLAAFRDLEIVQADLDTTNSDIEIVEGEISDKQEELSAAQDTLGARVASDYKAGGVSLVTIIFDSSNFEDLVSRIYYASKVAASDAAVIQEFQTIQAELNDKKTELETKQAEQQSLVDQATAKADELSAAQAEHEAYVASLSEEVQEALAEEEAARQAEIQKAAEAAAAAAAASASTAAASSTNTSGSATTSNAATTENAATNNSNSSNNSSSNNSSSSNESSSNNSSSSSSNNSSVPNYGAGVSAAISYACSRVGNSSYSYGASGPNSFDCSGLVWWAFNKAGLSIPRGQNMGRNGSNSMVARALNGGGWTTDAGSLSAGDLCFWSYSGSTSSTYHVALCIGGGQIVHAIPGGVTISSVYWENGTFLGGGPVV